MNEPEQLVKLTAHLMALGEGKLHMSAFEAWVLLAAVQLSWRHPSLTQRQKEDLWNLGHHLQSIFAEDQLIFDIAGMGWIPALDVARGREDAANG